MFFRVEKRYGTSSRGMQRASTFMMLLNALGKTGGFADIEASVGAAENVDPVGCRHRHLVVDPAYSTSDPALRLAVRSSGSLRAPSDSAPRGPRHVASRRLALNVAARSRPAMSEAPKGPSRMVEAAGFAPASENTSPQEYYDAYPLLSCRPRREEAAKNRRGPAPENLITGVRDTRRRPACLNDIHSRPAG